jgi:hypothetical protein
LRSFWLTVLFRQQFQYTGLLPETAFLNESFTAATN